MPSETNREVAERSQKERQRDIDEVEDEDDERCPDCGSTEAGNCFYCKVD